MLPVRGAYIWRGLYMKGLIFEILQYIDEVPSDFSAENKNVFGGS